MFGPKIKPMKYNNITAFEKHLEASSAFQSLPVYLFISKDPIEKKELIEVLLKKLSSKEECNIVKLEAEKILYQELYEELNCFSLFDKKKIIVLQNCEKVSKSLIELIEHFISRHHSSNSYLLVCTSSSLSSTNSFYKLIENMGIIVDISDLKPWEKEKNGTEWIQKIVLQNGFSIDPSAIQQLVKQIGTDKSLLANELEKIFCYVAERKSIHMEDIKAICSVTSQETIWKLSESIFKKEGKTALAILNNLIDEGNAFLTLLRQLRSQFQIGAQVASIIYNNGPLQEISKLFPYMKGKILELNVQQAKTYGLKNYLQGLITIDAFELKAKNSGIVDKYLAEQFLHQILFQANKK